MFGLVEKDIFLSNTTISGNTVAGKLSVPNVIYPISPPNVVLFYPMSSIYLTKTADFC